MKFWKWKLTQFSLFFKMGVWNYNVCYLSEDRNMGSFFRMMPFCERILSEWAERFVKVHATAALGQILLPGVNLIEQTPGIAENEGIVMVFGILIDIGHRGPVGAIQIYRIGIDIERVIVINHLKHVCRDIGNDNGNQRDAKSKKKKKKILHN